MGLNMEFKFFKKLKHKAHSLTGCITLELLKKAFDKVKRNKGAAGVDKITIGMFETNLAENLAKLQRELVSRNYKPKPLRRVYIEKDGGGKKLRPLSIPCVRGRTAQEALRHIIEPFFEPLFSDNSFGFRPKRSCHDAIRKIISYRDKGYKFVVDADIVGCFDNIPHNVIMKALSAVIADGNILTAVERCLKAGVVDNGEFKETNIGTPQGGNLSPLLTNIVLHELDIKLHQAGLPFVRYADDFVILTRTMREAEEAYLFAQNVLNALGLEVSKEKSKIASFDEGFDFLGFNLRKQHVKMSDKAVNRYKQKIRDITKRKLNLECNVIVKTAQVIRGTANYFGIPESSSKSLFAKLDRFTRTRFRCMKKKRIWKTDYYRIPNKMIQRWGVISISEFLVKTAAPP